MVENPYRLKASRIIRVIKECEGVYTFHIATEEEAQFGQYNMLYAFGRGEAPITIASDKEVKAIFYLWTSAHGVAKAC